MGTRARCTATLLFILLLSAGCWDHQPPETAAFIHMVGIDRNPENPAEMTVTQMIALPSALVAGGAGGGGGSQPEGTPYYLLSSTGSAVEGALLAGMDHLSRLPRLEHMIALVLGEDFARDGVGPTISWALRHPQVRPGAWLLVSEKSAQMFLDARPALDPLPGAAIAGLLRHADRIPSTMPVKIYEFAQTMLSPRRDGFAPLVRRVNPLLTRVPPGFEQQPFVGVGSSDTQSMDTQIQIIGMAIFSGDRMVGTLTGPDASGMVWLAGTSKAPVSVPHPQRSGHFLSALAIDTKTRNTADLRGDRLVLLVDVSVTMDAWEAGILEPVAVGTYVSEIEQALEEEIERDIRRTLAALRSMRADTFGFAEQLYRSAPADWHRIAAVWDDMYEQAAVEVTVDVHLRRSGIAR